MMTTSTPTTTSCHQSCRNTACPSWLQATLAELDEKFQSLGVSLSRLDEEGPAPDSFAERAENYYQKRPQLLSFLQDLYNRYLSLADRYAQRLLKPNNHHHHHDYCAYPKSQIADSTDYTNDPDPDTSYASDAESSLSFQLPPPPGNRPQHEHPTNTDAIVAELVFNAVEKDILLHEIGILEKLQSESSRKVGIQTSLLEVLESERIVLLSENARLGFQAAALAEVKEELAAEVAYMRRKAGELARCVLKLREDRHVCMLGRRIEGLQAKIYVLEKRNRECYEVMGRREEEKAELLRGVCLELERVKAENRKLRGEAEKNGGCNSNGSGKGGKVEKWWGRARKMDWVLCGSHVPGKEYV